MGSSRVTRLQTDTTCELEIAEADEDPLAPTASSPFFFASKDRRRASCAVAAALCAVVIVAGLATAAPNAPPPSPPAVLLNLTDDALISCQYDLQTYPGLSAVCVRPPAPPRPRVACALYTYHKNREHQLASYLTWGKSCQPFLAYSDELWEIAPGVQTVPLRHAGGLGSYDGTWQAVRKMHAHMAGLIESGGPMASVDFVIMGGDDMYWVWDNLLPFLAQLDPDRPHHIGGVNAVGMESSRADLPPDGAWAKGIPWVRGSGYILSRRVFTARMLDKCSPVLRDVRTSSEDMQTSRCLWEQGVVPTDGRDRLGRVRFCMYNPWAQPGRCNDVVDPALPAAPDVFLLHYLPPGQMLALHHFVSTCAPANSACDERLSGSPRFPSLHVPRANGPSP